MEKTFDVVIIGAGPAGLSLARSLSLIGLSTLLVEAEPLVKLQEPAFDGRDIALTHFSRKQLEALGIWAHIPKTAVSAIREARIYDGQSSHFMKFSKASDELAFIVSNHLIRGACFEVIKNDSNICLLNGVRVETLEIEPSSAVVRLSNGEMINASLVIGADSRFSETRRKLGISARMNDFGKTMILCQMDHELEHHGIAYECFHHGHTLAVLPLSGCRSSVVLTLPPIEAERMLQLSDADFSLWVGQQFQSRLGPMSLATSRFCYPLIGVYADRFVAQRSALIGDAAVGMHPVTAHGFNFGLMSVHRLSELLREALMQGRDIATPEVLLPYERGHKRATRPLYLATNGIVSLYTNDRAEARIARKLLLRAADNMRPIKSFMMAKLTEKKYLGGLL